MALALLAPLSGAQLTPVLDGVQKGQLHDKLNILVILADDIGIDEVGAYGAHTGEVHTPRIDALAAEGLLFRNAWVTPGCSPTRAMLLTGTYPHQNGVGRAIGFEPSPGNEYELPVDTLSVADILSPTHHTAAFGKWHLSLQGQTAYAHPLLLGFDHHVGAVDNFTSTNRQTFYDYVKAVDGVPQPSTGYATSETVDDALSAIHTYGDQPWFVYVAFQSAHAPYHKPPAELHSFDLPGEVWMDKALHMRAMVEAMDTEIGRLLDGLPPAVRARTLVLFLGDNGTPAAVTTPPASVEVGKGSLFESGVRVPFIVTGPGVVQGQECLSIVSGVDLMATLADVAGLALHHGVFGQSISLLPYFSNPMHTPLRTWVYSERFSPNGFGPFVGVKRAARTARHKLILYYDGSLMPTDMYFFDLSTDPGEQTNLLGADTDLTAGQQGALELLLSIIDSQGEPG